MKNTIFTGAAVAITTPFNLDGTIDFKGLGDNIDYQIENGTDAIVICGTTGESSTMTDAEHRECIKFAVEHTAHRVPVIAGTGSNDTRYAIELSVEAQDLGADGLLLVTPYYNKTTQAGLFDHFTIIANSVNIPIVLYNIPGRTGMNIAVETLEKLGHHKNIVAVKEASGNISFTAQVMAACGHLLDVYSGNDDQIVPIMALGGKGVISVLSNILPKETHEICQLCLDNDFQKAGELQIKYLDLINSLFCEVNPIPVKEAMNQLGMAAGACRMPLTKMSADNVARLLSAMQKLGMPVPVVD